MNSAKNTRKNEANHLAAYARLMPMTRIREIAGSAHTLQIDIPRRLIEKFLRKMLPIVAEAADAFKDKADPDGLTPKLKENIALYGIEPWAEAYEDPAMIFAAPLSALFCIDNSPEQFLNPPKFETLDDFYRWLDSVWQECERDLETTP